MTNSTDHEFIQKARDTTDKNARELLKNLFKGHVGAFHIDVRRSKGSRAWLADEGREVIDMNQHLASRPLGYNHPVFNSKEYRDMVSLYAANKLAYSTYFTTDFARACRIIEDSYLKHTGFDRMFFVAGGAKAVEVAVHIAVINKVEQNIQAGRGEIGNKVLTLFGGFHGRGLGMRSVTTSIPEKNEYLPVFDDWSAIDAPASDEESAKSLNQLEERIKALGPEHVAGFIMEDVIQCGWGDRYIPRAFCDGVRRLADQYGFYMIADGVQTGMYSSGEPFAHQAWGSAQPDIIAGCKKSATGYVLVTDKITEVKGNAIDSTISINSTFGGHMSDIMTWAYVLKVIENEDLVSNIKARGEQMLAGLKQIGAKYTDLTNARGLGLIGLALSAPDGEVLSKLTAACHKNGLMIFPGTTPAPDGYAVRFRPVLDVAEEEIATTLELLDKSAGEVFA